eukprot:TRINITY_DN4478_c0_g1_i8.p1 TRINITY_DN4478_c0_g1~~TRINITY_DN4478_c0_g1_i8.p1  ORF type:complete len:275 (-),score=20.75 TRINITY_DN4478_c0_g1_i8:366-1190(-)
MVLHSDIDLLHSPAPGRCTNIAPDDRFTCQQQRNNLSIEQFLIGSKINGLYYVPDFITEEEHDAIVNFIVTADKQWVQGEGRRISNWGGQPYRQNVTEELPPFLQSVIQGLVQIGAHEEHLAPNHCLINDYAKGRGVSFHRDGPLYLPRVSTLTLCGSAVINFKAVKENGDSVHFDNGFLRCAGSCNCQINCENGSWDVNEDIVEQVFLQKRGLLVMSGEACQKFEHGIFDANCDLIGKLCCNRDVLGLKEGDKMYRSGRRMSMVFVTKKQLWQ